MKAYKDYYKIMMLRKKFRAKAVWSPFGRWYDKKFNFKGKLVLDFGSSIRSNFYKKFIKDNRGKRQNYRGYDIDKKSVEWLKKEDFYYSFFDDDSLKGKFDLINCSQVYEHLTLEERESLIERSYELLKPKGVLLLDFPYINNLNLIEFFHGDRTHKVVSCEDEASYIARFGFECKVYIGGFTWPYQSLLRNTWSFIWNIILGFYPFHITLIEAVKK